MYEIERISFEIGVLAVLLTVGVFLKISRFDELAEQMARAEDCDLYICLRSIGKVDSLL